MLVMSIDLSCCYQFTPYFKRGAIGNSLDRTHPLFKRGNSLSRKANIARCFAVGARASSASILFRVEVPSGHCCVHQGSVSGSGVQFQPVRLAKHLLDAYEQAIQKASIAKETYYIEKGSALIELKQYEEAIKVLDRAIRLKPDYALAYNLERIRLWSFRTT